MFGGYARRVSRIITFADEIKPEPNKPWAYVAIISVPADRCKEALERLLADRQAHDNPMNPCGEIGWSDLKNMGARARIVHSWLDRVTNEHDLWRFSILGIDTSKLVMTAFGEGLGYQRLNIYKRFYRSCLAYHVATLSRRNDSVEVVRCYHDKEGRLEQDDWFRWHAQERISKAGNVTFGCREVTFVDSDHRREQKNSSASHFIQLCDVLAGASRYLLENHSPSEARDFASRPFLPLLERINCPKQSLNVNSRYRHVGRASISYFPSRPLEEHELEDPFVRGLSTFYKGRTLRHQKRDQAGFEFEGSD